MVDQRLVPHGVQSVLQGLGAKLVGLEGEKKQHTHRKSFQTNDKESGIVALLDENASLMLGVKSQDGSDRLVEKMEKQHWLQPRCAEQHLGTKNMGLSFSVSVLSSDFCLGYLRTFQPLSLKGS